MIKSFLEQLSNKVETNRDYYKEINNGQNFEDLVYSEMKNIANESGIKVARNGTHDFPDTNVILQDGTVFGVEIKFSASGHWKSKGNSVFESLSNKATDEKAYKDIYVFFGRKPKVKEGMKYIEIKFAPYGLSVDRLEVTHSPRFAIDMNSSDHDLSKLFGDNKTYADFRIQSNTEKTKLLQQYFKEQFHENASTKWYMPEVLDSATGNAEPILFVKLNPSQRKNIVAEAFIIFPFDLFKSSANYSNIAARMISKHFVYSPNLRDNFSASGRDRIFETEQTEYPRVLKIFKEHQRHIKELLRNPVDEEFESDCYTAWDKYLEKEGIKTIEFDKEGELEVSYEKLISHITPELKTKDLITLEEKFEKISLEKFYTFEKI